MLCYGFPWPQVPACSAQVSSWLKPLLHLVDQITFCVFPHTTKQDSQPTASLISKQAIPYRTHGDTCCPRVSTPKTRSLADSSMTNHITWWILSVPTIPTLLKLQHRTSPRSTHITMDGRPTLSTLRQAKLNIIKMKDFYDSHDYRAKQYYLDRNPNPKGISRYSIKKCMQ
jgi:hypothetical protein